METNEALARVLRQESEREIQELVRLVCESPTDNLKGLEQHVLQAVWRLGKALLAAILAWRTHREPAATQRAGSCGHQQHLVGWRPKKLLTLLGEVPWSRPYYQCQLEASEQEEGRPEAAEEEETRCTHGEAPADGQWGVQGRRTSAGVQEVVSYLAAHLTLEEAAATFSRLLPLEMSARQVLSLLMPVGEALRQQEDAQVEARFQKAVPARTETQAMLLAELPPIERLYIELDGVTARLRRGSVPMKAEEHARGGDVYREVKVGAVFPATRGPERSGLAPGVWVDIPCEDTIQYVARRTTSSTFGALLYALAEQEGLSRAQQVVVLGDGAPWIWRQVEEHFPGAVQIVDLWHAQQHVWQVARAVFGRSTPTGTTWAQQACSHLVQGQIEDLVAAISALPAVPPPPGQTRSVPEQAVDYFTTNAARMRYPVFRAQGMHVGSGIAEAACKTVVSSRAKRSGMRWTPDGLDALLPLRTAVLNGTYDTFWQHQSAVLT